MKKILLGLALLVSFSVNAQIRVCQLPQVTSGTLNDYIIKEDSTCNGTRKIKVGDFLTAYGIGSGGGGGSTDTTSLSNRINNKVDTIYKNSTGDSFVYNINGRRHALLDSTGSTEGFLLLPIEVSWTGALSLIGSIVEGQMYKINNDDSNLPSGIDYVMVTGLSSTEFSTTAKAKLTQTAGLSLGNLVDCYYNVADDKLSLVISFTGLITQTGTSDPVVTVVQNQLAHVTYACSWNDVGKYVVTLVDAITPNAVFDPSAFTKAWIEIQGTVVTASDVSSPFAFASGHYSSGTGDFRIGTQVIDLITGLTSTDGILTDTPFSIKLAIFN